MLNKIKREYALSTTQTATKAHHQGPFIIDAAQLNIQQMA